MIPAAQYPTVAAEQTKLAALKTDLADNEARQTALSDQGTTSTVDAVELAALDLLAGRQGKDRAKIRRELTDLQEKAVILQRAIGIQAMRVKDAVYEASKDVAAELDGDRRAIRSRITDAIAAIRAAVVADEQLRQEFARAGYRSDVLGAHLTAFTFIRQALHNGTADELLKQIR